MVRTSLHFIRVGLNRLHCFWPCDVAAKSIHFRLGGAASETQTHLAGACRQCSCPPSSPCGMLKSSLKIKTCCFLRSFSLTRCLKAWRQQELENLRCTSLQRLLRTCSTRLKGVGQACRRLRALHMDALAQLAIPNDLGHLDT